MNKITTISSALPWQQTVWSGLAQQLEEDKLPHAIMLCGPQYAGKAQLAMALARLLLCHQPDAGHNCGKCHACDLSQSGSHGDFRWMEPEGKSRVTKVDQVRQLVEFGSKTASLGRRKVVVLYPAESMNMSAANALLKSLEEPSAETYLILVCHRPHGLPATIRSRCQIMRLSMPERQQALQWLDQLTGSREDSEKALDLAQGQVQLAAQLYQDASLDRAQAVQTTLNALGSGRANIQDLNSLLAEEPIENLLTQLHEHLRDRVQSMDATDLTSASGRAMFGLLDDVIRLQRVVFSGANPNRQLLVDSLTARFEMVLT